MSATGPEMETLKTRLKAMWMSGNFGEIAKAIETNAEEFIDRLALEPGVRVLDVACGTGNLAIPAAGTGAIVTGADIATNLLEQARARAAAEGLTIQFDEGDAEKLPYGDAAFDVFRPPTWLRTSACTTAPPSAPLMRSTPTGRLRYETTSSGCGRSIIEPLIIRLRLKPSTSRLLQRESRARRLYETGIGSVEIQPQTSWASEAPASEPGAAATGSLPPHSTPMAAGGKPLSSQQPVVTATRTELSLATATRSLRLPVLMRALRLRRYCFFSLGETKDALHGYTEQKRTGFSIVTWSYALSLLDSS